ncbi:response regulator [Sphingomonas crocodyli]|uniref:Response regulator n=1 Tax=Sphingomonas crocodyli TaxID=1979270 RepID=A0A437LXQ3_9SPHN|nr:response regulator [Sphingomonas crocodyli]RVT90191.1 response regulator [Sphingomonas crocodyli]
MDLGVPETEISLKSALVVDDETLIRQIISAELLALGYQVFTAASADEAIVLLSEGSSFDLLITDVRMPGSMDGIELSRKMRECCVEQQIIIMSGFTGYDAVNSQEFLHFLQKPFTAKRLREEISRLVHV